MEESLTTTPFGATLNASFPPSPTTSDAAAACHPPRWSTSGGAIEEEDDELRQWGGGEAEDEPYVRFDEAAVLLQPSVARPVASRVSSGDVVLGRVFS